MTTGTSLIVGALAGLAVAAVTVIGLQHLRPAASTAASNGASTPFDATPAASSTDVPVVAAASGERPAESVAAQTTHSVPVTPVYGPLPPGSSIADVPAAQSLPDDPRTIYRCRTNSRTVYSNDPCPNATVVDDSNAASGYDTRPSDKLARLVAEGRADESASDPAPAPTVRRKRSVAPQSAECAILRRQIRDLDAAAASPQYPHVLDEIRATRQDVQTSLARNRC